MIQGSSIASRHRRARGMTLVEVMISFAILIAGLVGIIAMLNAGYRSHRRAIAETESSLVGDSVISDLRAEYSRGGTPPGDGAGIFQAHPDYPGYSFNRQIVPLEKRKGSDSRDYNREFFIRVEVRWAEQGDNKSVSFDTIMFSSDY